MKLVHGGDWAGFKNEYGRMPLDLSANISPLGMPQSVKDAIIKSVELSERYPDPLCRELRTALSAYHGIPAENIVCGNGAADIIFRLVQCLKPKKAVVTAPGFAEYEQALKANGCEVTHFMLTESDDFTLGENILEVLDDETDMVFICQPNNPTGRTVEKKVLHAVLDKCRACGIIPVIDECFTDFLDAPRSFSLEDRISEEPGLIILKAFTKMYAMPGIRLGYCLCSDAVTAEAIRACGQPWAVSVPAQMAGIAALWESEYVEKVRKTVSEERAFLSAGLSELGFRTVSASANFILFRSPVPQLSRKLRTRGVLIRDCSNYKGLSEGWYRTAVKSREESLELLKALKEVLADG